MPNWFFLLGIYCLLFGNCSISSSASESCSSWFLGVRSEADEGLSWVISLYFLEEISPSLTITIKISLSFIFFEVLINITIQISTYNHWGALSNWIWQNFSYKEWVEVVRNCNGGDLCIAYISLTTNNWKSESTWYLWVNSRKTRLLDDIPLTVLDKYSRLVLHHQSPSR